MNVAPSNIAPAQPPVSTFRPGTQTAPEGATPNGFADAMQSAQPKDASQSGPSSAATSQLTTDAEEASKPSLPQQVLKNNAPAPQCKPFALTVAEDASITVIDAETPGSSAGHDGSCLSPQPQLPGAQQAPGLVSAPFQDAIKESALHLETDPTQESDAAAKNISPGAPIAFASAADSLAADATAADASVVDASAVNAPITDASVADAASPFAPLNGKKFGMKPLEASAGTPVKKTLHAHAASVQGPVALQPVTASGHPAQVTSGALAPVAFTPEPNAPTFAKQDVPGTTSVPIAIKTASQIAPLPYAMQAAKNSAAAPQDVQSTPTEQPVISTPVPTEASIARGPAPMEMTTGQTSQSTAGDERSDASFARSVFSEAVAAAPRSTEPAAVFAPTLVTQAASGDTHHVSAVVSSAPSLNAAGAPPEGAMVQAAPVRLLEVTVNDPLLGNMDVRAEMRGGVLHASLTGAQESTAAAMPALHQFLQQHDVNVHTLTFATAADGVAPTGSALSAGNGMGRDAAESFAGSAGTGSQQQQGSGAHSQGERSTEAHTGYTATSPATYMAQRPGMPAAMIANNVIPIGSTLSIHI